jgi:ribosomal protein S2
VVLTKDKEEEDNKTIKLKDKEDLKLHKKNRLMRNMDGVKNLKLKALGLYKIINKKVQEAVEEAEGEEII